MSKQASKMICICDFGGDLKSRTLQLRILPIHSRHCSRFAYSSDHMVHAMLNRHSCKDPAENLMDWIFRRMFVRMESYTQDVCCDRNGQSRSNVAGTPQIWDLFECFGEVTGELSNLFIEQFCNCSETVSFLIQRCRTVCVLLTNCSVLSTFEKIV